jgi:hypothetical protein
LCFRLDAAPFLIATGLRCDGDFAMRILRARFACRRSSSASALSRSSSSARFAFSASSADSNFVFSSALVASSLRRRWSSSSRVATTSSIVRACCSTIARSRSCSVSLAAKRRASSAELAFSLLSVRSNPAIALA